MLRVSRAHFPITTLGPGRRMVVWLQGCPLACKGCMSRDTWDFDGGVDIAEADLVGMWRDAVGDGADGLTVSGGEPLAQAASLGAFLRAVRAFPSPSSEPDVLLYTGYDLDELDAAQLSAIAAADAVITGRFDAARPTRLIWRGSANQRLLTRTALGHRKYAAYRDYVPEHAPVQIGLDGERLWVIGVPAPGALQRMERTLRARGIRFEGATWRP